MAQPWSTLLGAPASALYGMVVAARNRRFDRGLGVAKLDRPVVGIGNLSVGGTGKTPMVRWVCRALLDAGVRPCIAMRGYGKRDAQRSDEEDELHRRLPGVPIVAQPNRLAGLRWLLAQPAPQPIGAIVLDDGFQHRRIARQLDIVLVDASRPMSHLRLLPWGWLREPIGSLARAHAIVLTHTDRAKSVTELERRVRSAAPSALVARARHAWSGLEWTGPEGARWTGVEPMAGLRVLVVCGIGQPSLFLESCTQAGASIAQALILPDHDPYAPATIAQIIGIARRHDCAAIVTTDKDWSKLRHVEPGRWPCPVVRPLVDIEFDGVGEQLRQRIVALVDSKREPPSNSER